MSFFGPVYLNALPAPAYQPEAQFLPDGGPPPAEAVAALAALTAGILPLRDRGILSGRAVRLFDRVWVGPRGALQVGDDRRAATAREKRLCAAASGGEYVPGDRTNACRFIVCDPDKRYGGCAIVVRRPTTGEAARVKRAVQHLHSANEFQQMFEAHQAETYFEPVD